MQCTRRQLLASAAALPSLAAGSGYKPRLGAALYVWMQQFDREGKKLDRGVDEAFPATARAGFRRVELASQFWTPEVRPETVRMLKKARLAAVSVYNGGPMHDEAAALKTIGATLAVAEIAKAAGARTVCVNADPKRERKTDEELNIQARSLDKLGQRLASRGMPLLIHQHAPEMREDAREWRHILHNTDPKLVQFCLDLDWVKRGGQDPMTLLKEAGSRLGSLHVRSARNGVWMEDFGDGDVDYREIAAYLREVGFQGDIFVELAYEKQTAVTRSVEENLKRSLEYAQTVFL